MSDATGVPKGGPAASSTPGPTSRALASRWAASLAPNYATPGLFLGEGRGMRVRDVDGREKLDFIAGLAVLSLGHAHPKVAQAIATQAARLGHVSNLYGTEEVVRLAERLQTETGYGSDGRVFFCNSGLEANEFALKLARRHGNRRGIRDGVILSAENSFHGRSVGEIALQGQEKYRKDFDPLPPGFGHVPYNDVAALERAFQAGNVTGLFLEPIQGEGGVVPATTEYLRAARKLTREHGALLVVDEIQTGIGRTGRFLAQEHAGIRADVTTLAKGLAAGFPIGAAVTTLPTAALFGPGDHGCTFGGNPLACAAALATLDAIRDERLVENAEKTGAYLRDRLAAALGGRISGVRGVGLLDAIVLKDDRAKAVRDAAQEAGLLVNAASDRVLRLAPPLIATSGDADEAVAILAKVI